MHGEFSRLTFDPRKHVSAVLQQQGRVGLDSDWNESAEVTLRRQATETVDVIGACGCPKDNAGFEIKSNPAKGSPAVKLSAGRLYAGGMLAELEKETDFLNQYDWPIPTKAKWSSLSSKTPWPGLDFDGFSSASRRDLFYAEVWQRHVTAVNDEAERDQAVTDASGKPDWNTRPEVGDLIRERALGGPDTCTHLQTVAQVKLFTVDKAITTCEAACAALSTALPKATTGTMRVEVQPAAPVVSPCEEAQTGGYGGAENRTYRVQIHDPGGPGTATFKYSTENGAFMVRVEAAALTRVAVGTALTLLSIGNDQTTQLKAGDWVELCGEETELGMFRNPLAQLVADPVALADGKWRIQLTAAVIVPRAPFLRRWSEAPKVITLGTLFALDAGSGLSVRFTDDAGGIDTTKAFFHELDYWIWSARTITRSVEPAGLTQTPQRARGIERAYCCLALVTWTAVKGKGVIEATSIADCREKFDNLVDLTAREPRGEGCACTVCVIPDPRPKGTPSLQQAIELVRKAGGGTICLEAGVYDLENEPLKITDAKSLRIVGKGKASKIKAGSTAIEVTEKSIDVSLEGFSVECIGKEKGPGSAISLRSSSQVRVERLRIESKSGSAIGLGGALAGVVIRENTVTAVDGIINLPDLKKVGTGLQDLLIEDNQFDCQRVAIRLTGVSVHQQVSRLTGNRIRGCTEAGFVLTGATVPGFGIEVIGNEFEVMGDGIVAGVDGLRIIDNDLIPLEPLSKKKQRGIVLTKGMTTEGQTGNLLDDCQIVGNRIVHLTKKNKIIAVFDCAILAEVALGAVTVARNHITIANNGLKVLVGPVKSLSIDNNQMIDITGIAIDVLSKEGQRVAVRGNHIEATGQAQPSVHITCVGGDCVYSDNHFQQLKGGDKGGVKLKAKTLVVASNRILGKVVMDLQPDNGTFGTAKDEKKGPLCTVLGNITHGDILVLGKPLTPPWAPLNLERVA